MAKPKKEIRPLAEEVTQTAAGRRALEEEILIGDVTDTIAALLEETGLSQRELSERLGVTEGRVSQILSGTGNLRLRSLGAIGWALGVRFGLRAATLADRQRTPAASDPPIREWAAGEGGQKLVNTWFMGHPRVEVKEWRRRKSRSGLLVRKDGAVEELAS